MCFLAEVEKKHLFIENLHGTNIVVMADMSVSAGNKSAVDNMGVCTTVFRGAR